MNNKREWLINIRTGSGLKQKDVAIKSNIKSPTYCLIESGKRRPSPEVAKKIAAILGFDWTRFYEEESA